VIFNCFSRVVLCLQRNIAMNKSEGTARGGGRKRNRRKKHHNNNGNTTIELRDIPNTKLVPASVIKNVPELSTFTVKNTTKFISHQTRKYANHDENNLEMENTNVRAPPIITQHQEFAPRVQLPVTYFPPKEVHILPVKQQATKLYLYQPEKVKKKELPIAEHHDEVVRLIKNNRIVIVTGYTGCGKSTRKENIFVH
jgi:hypothetical protein